jgi:sporulation protein YlmC with PRC-barrel domain
MHIKLSDLPGRAVFDANGVVLGKIKSPLVDMETWSVDVLGVKLSRPVAREMGLDASLFAWLFRPATIDVPTGLVQAAGDAIILRVSLAELRDAAPEQFSEAATESMH